MRGERGASRVSSILWIFAIFDAGALLVLAAELLPARPSRARNPGGARRDADVWVAIVVVSYAVQLALTAYAAYAQPGVPVRARVFPLPLAGPVPAHRDAVVAAMLVLAAVQSYALLCVYRGNASRRAVVAGAASLLALSFASPAMISADAYAYAGDALLGRLAYAPPAVPFSLAFAAIDRWWHPLPPTPYGPLWLGVAWFATAALPTLTGKLLALRALGGVAYVATALLLRALGLPWRTVAIAAVNPGLAYEYVGSAHNDLTGIVPIVAAALYARRAPIVAALLLLAGALVKLPFAIFGWPVLAGVRDRRLRATLLVAVPVAAVALTFAAGGSGFAQAMVPHLTSSPLMRVLTGAVGAIVTIAMAIAAFGGRRLRSTVLLAPLAPAYTCAWYFAWGLPYAIARRRVLGYLLIAFPLAAILLEVKFMTPWTLFGIVPAVAAWQILAMRTRQAPS